VFQTHHGQFEFTVMAFDLTGAPATFLSAMNDTLKDFLHKFVLVFFDDILIYSQNYQEHIQHIAQVLKRLQDHHWQVKKSKCAFAQQTIAYLGHLILAAGVSTDPEKIHTVREWLVPTICHRIAQLSGPVRLLQEIRQALWHHRQASDQLTAQRVNFLCGHQLLRRHFRH
jgi:hypothetical protein